jgi:hypothetical protein
MEDVHGPDSIHFSPFFKGEEKMLPTVNKLMLTLKTDRHVPIAHACLFSFCCYMPLDFNRHGDSTTAAEAVICTPGF